MEVDVVEITDNFLPKPALKEIQDILMSRSTPYYLQRGIVSDTEDSRFLFTHVIYYDNQPVSDLYRLMNETFRERLKVFQWARIQANLTPRAVTRIQTGFHTDMPNAPKGLTTSILYLNTTNGGTAFSNQIVEGIENRLVTFEQEQLHSAITHTDVDARWVINLNYYGSKQIFNILT